MFDLCNEAKQGHYLVGLQLLRRKMPAFMHAVLTREVSEAVWDRLICQVEQGDLAP